jgi:hypothetical protein
VTVSATLGALQGAAVMEIFRRFNDAEFHADWHAAKAVCGDGVRPADLARTAAQRRADALFAVFEQAASTPRDARRPAPLVNIVVDWDTFSNELSRRHSATVPTMTRAPTRPTGAVPTRPTGAATPWPTATQRATPRRRGASRRRTSAPRPRPTPQRARERDPTEPVTRRSSAPGRRRTQTPPPVT